MDQSLLPRMAFADLGQPMDPSSWEFAHHWVLNAKAVGSAQWNSGQLLLHTGGLLAAWKAAVGEGLVAPEDYIEVAHLRRHLNDIGYTSEDLQKLGGGPVDELDARLVKAGMLEPRDLELSIAGRVQRVLRT